MKGGIKMIELNNIHISYDNKECIRNGHFIAYPYQITVIYGESGTGKSSLLYMIGMLSSQQHEYIYHHKLLNLDEKQKSQFRYEHISMITQNAQLIETISVENNIEFYLRQNLSSYNSKDLLELVHMTEKKNAMPHSLSGGERQRVAIACALAKDSDIILGDEMTSALDDDNKQIVMNLLRECANKGKTVILVSHEKKIVEKCDRIYKLDHLELSLEKEVEPTHSDIIIREIKKIKPLEMFQLLFHSNRKYNHRRVLLSLIITAILLTSVSILIQGYRNLQLDEFSLQDICHEKILVLSDESGIYHTTKYGMAIRIPDNYEPISIELIDTIENISQIDKIYDYYILQESMIDNNGNIIYTSMNATRGGELIDKKEATDEYYINDSDYLFSVIPVFKEEELYTQEDGVYVDSNLAYIYNLEVGDILELNLNVPYAMILETNTFSDSVIGSGVPYHKVHCLGEQVSYTTQVLGVIEANSENKNGIYMNNDFIEQMINEKIQEYQKGEIIVDEKKFEGFSTLMDLQPYAKAIFADKYENVLKILNEINRMSDKIFAYSEYQSILELMEENQDIAFRIFLITCVGIFIFIIGAFVIEMMYLRKYQTTYMMMNLIGFDQKNKLMIYLIQSLWQFMVILCIGVVVYLSASLLNIVISLFNMDYFEVMQYVPDSYYFYMVYFGFSKIHVLMFVVISLIIIGIANKVMMKHYDNMDIVAWMRSG